MLMMGRTVCGFASRPPRTVYSWEREQKYNVGECVHEKNHKGSEAWHAGERTKPGLASQRVGWIEYSPGPAKGEIEVSSTLLMERSRASQPRQSKTFVEKAMEDKKSTRLCDGTPHGAAVSNFLGCSRHQQRLCRRPRCLAHLGKPQSMRADGGLRGEKDDTSLDMHIDKGKSKLRKIEADTVVLGW